MHVDRQALDEAVAKRAFTGVVTIDEGERRTSAARASCTGRTACR